MLVFRSLSSAIKSSNHPSMSEPFSTPTAIIVTGPPASGKTTFAHAIAKEFSLPLFCKDDIKELLFEHLGWSDREWSRKCGIATYGILYYLMASELRAQKSFVVESNFQPRFDTPKLLALQKEFSCRFIQVRLDAEKDVLLKRFHNRNQSNKRHPGHCDEDNEKNFTNQYALRHGVLDIGGDLFEIDTTDFSKIDTPTLLSQIREKITL